MGSLQKRLKLTAPKSVVNKQKYEPRAAERGMYGVSIMGELTGKGRGRKRKRILELLPERW